MPIYEYLCRPCNRIYSFLLKSAAETRTPTCPKCGSHDMKRTISRFAVVGVRHKSKTRDAEAGAAPDSGAPSPAAPAENDAMDDPRVEREMERLIGDAEGLDENDPRQLGRLMRRMTEITGEKVDPAMEDAMRRLESGEDPEKIEEDMDEVLGDGDEAGPGAPPSRDAGLYTL